jgi:phage terminase small subunit
MTKKKESAKTAESRLTDKQLAFVRAYTGEAGLNGYRAAEAAGYGGDRVVLNNIAQQNLRNPHIRKMISEYLETNAMTAGEVLAELSKVAKAPMDDLSDPRLVKNKVTALTVLAKHHGLLTDRLDVTTGGAPLTFADLAKLANEHKS